MSQAAAFFDVDGTLLRSNIAHYYAYMRGRELPPGQRPFWNLWFLCKGVAYLCIDRFSRSTFNRLFYRNYRHLSAAGLKRLAPDVFTHVIRPNLSAQGLDTARRHQAAGHKLVLVTGSLDFIMEPLARYLGVARLEAVKLRTYRGKFTGSLEGEIMSGQEKRRRVLAYAEAAGVDLQASYAYGDSIADGPMLEAVGHPVAVNPDRKLARLADARGWPIQHWSAFPNGGKLSYLAPSTAET